MTKAKLVSVVIVTHNRKEELRECVNSFLHSSYRNLEIIVVDNASSERVDEYLPRSKKVKLIRSRTNLGAAGGRNLGLLNSKGEFVLFSDDDAIADKKMISKLLWVFERKKEAGIVQPVIFDRNNKTAFQGAGHDINLLTGRIKPYGIDALGRAEEDRGQYKGIREVPMCGCVWMVKRNIFNTIGNYDEEYFIPYEDSDLSVRVRKAGFKLYCSYEARAYHPVIKESDLPKSIQFLGISSVERAFRVSRNKIIFMGKHSPFPYNLVFFLVFFPAMVLLHSLVFIVHRKTSILLNYWKGLFSGIRYLLGMERSFYRIAFLVLIVSLATYVAVKPSFELSLFGDDWLVFFDIIESSGSGKALDPTTLQGYFGPYTYPHYYMGIIRNFWGYNSLPYYLVSYIFRSLAAFSLAIFVLATTKKFFASVATGIFFGVTAAGIETTNWVFNAPSYLSIIFLTFSLLILVKKRKKLLHYLASLLLLALSIMMFPQRMHGVIPLYALLLTLQYFLKIGIWSLKQYLLRVVLIIGITFFLYKMNTFGAPEGLMWLSGQASASIEANGPFVASSIFASYGNLFVPDEVWIRGAVSSVARNLVGGSLIEPRIGFIAILFAFGTFLISRLLHRKRARFVFVSFVLFFAAALFFKTFVVGKVDYFLNISNVMATFTGVFVASWASAYFFVLESRKERFLYLIIFIWPFMILFISWVRNGLLPMSTILRYMVVAGAGAPLLIGFIMANIKGVQRKFLFFSILTIPLFMHLVATYGYLHHLTEFRDRHTYEVLWDDFFERMDSYGYYPTPEPVLVYFVGDYERLYNIFFFGFPPRVAIEYNIHDYERQKIPTAFDNFTTLLEFASNKDVVPDNIYAFKLEGGNLIDIRRETLSMLYEKGYSPTLNQ